MNSQLAVKYRNGIALVQTKDRNKSIFSRNNKIVIRNEDAIYILKFDDIISLQAKSNYTKIHLENKRSVLVSKTLKLVETQLNDTFVRVHKSTTVNIMKIKRYELQDQLLVMEDDSRVQVARSRKKQLIHLLNHDDKI